jgi:hypothetical protein
MLRLGANLFVYFAMELLEVTFPHQTEKCSA